MNEKGMAGKSRNAVCQDEPGVQRAGRGGFAGCYENYTGGGIAATLDASYYKGPGARNGKEREFLAVENEGTERKRKYIVRRLTPTECARLQGFPDWWTDGADGSDSAKYKLWGNGIALPCAEDVLRRIAEELRKDDEQRSD